MKKKNGFIATSLIYSFFLAFLTLFLTVVADYLQNKVLLNTIEEGIKTELNNEMSVNDFSTTAVVGDDSKVNSFKIVSLCNDLGSFAPETVSTVNKVDKDNNSITYSKDGKTEILDFDESIVQRCDSDDGNTYVVIKKVGGL